MGFVLKKTFKKNWLSENLLSLGNFVVVQHPKLLLTHSAASLPVSAGAVWAEGGRVMSSYRLRGPDGCGGTMCGCPCI